MTLNPNGADGFLGVLMLDTCFPRPWGDIGHAQSFAVPVQQAVVTRAVPAAIVTQASALAASGLQAQFIHAAQQLAAQGAWAVTTSCGFLIMLQAALQAAVPVPVRSSSLLQLPELLRRHARVGVLTIDAQALGREHLLAAGVPEARLADVVIQEVNPQGEFACQILGNRAQMDVAQAQADVVQAAVALKNRAPDLSQLVLECTNMPPYQRAIESATALRCYSLRDDPVLASLAALRGWPALRTPWPDQRP